MTATLAGYVGQGDGNGDYFSLGNVLAGTQINLVLTQPASSTAGGRAQRLQLGRDQPHQQPGRRQHAQLHGPRRRGGTYYARVSSASTTTVSFWMDWNGNNNEMPISFFGQYLYLDSGYFGFDDNGNDVYGISSAGLANGWHLVTATFVDGNDTKGQLWIDGVQQTLTQRQGTSGGASLLYTLVAIGSDNGSYDFTGELDEVAFFTGTLTAAQVQAEYAARTSASSYSSVVLSQNPVAYYRLGEAAGGTVAYDSSGKFDNARFGTGVTPGVAGNPRR